MDYGMEDLVEGLYSEPSEIDEDYEFDASKFFDFAMAEFDYEIEEAERWFEVSGDYPISPFIMKLNLEKILSLEVGQTHSCAKSSVKSKSSSSTSEFNSGCGVPLSRTNAKGNGIRVLQDITKYKRNMAQKTLQSRSSTLMKPTASHLAKQAKVLDLDSSCSCSRSSRSSVKDDEKSSQSSSGLDNLATKRQKLEIGYLRKVSRLKNNIALIHKSSKKVTVPRGPELETKLRAFTRRCKKSSLSADPERLKEERLIKTLSSNSKIQHHSSLPKPVKNKPQMLRFQTFHLKTTQSANQRDSTKKSIVNTVNPSGSTDMKRPNSRCTLKPGKNLQENTLTEAFGKLQLSLRSNDTNNKEFKTHQRMFVKVSSKENAPCSFRPESLAFHGKSNRCRSPMKVIKLVHA